MSLPKHTIRNPPVLSPLSFNHVTQTWPLSNSHMEYYGYLALFIEYQKEINAFSNANQLSVSAMLELQDNRVISELGWVNEHIYRADYLSILNTKTFKSKVE